MQSIQSPIAAVDSKSHRKDPPRRPLQPKNFNAGSTPPPHQNPKTVKKSSPLVLLDGNMDKENRPIRCLDASLAEELVAIRRKMERLREDWEKTEKVLRKRELMLEKQMKEMEKREREQRTVEIEIDRLGRLKHLKDSCKRIHPSKSLRATEQEKRIIKETRLQQEGKGNDEKGQMEAKTAEEEAVTAQR